ncbi:FIZZY-related 2-like protein, partial [Tanacetum coccineum]
VSEVGDCGENMSSPFQLVHWKILVASVILCLHKFQILDAPAFQDDFYLNLVDWSSHNVLAVGLGNYVTKLYDLCNDDSVGRLGGHNGGLVLLLGLATVKFSRDKSILQRDPRAQEAFVSKLNGHKSEASGLRWSYDNRELASCGNDNMRQSQMSASNNMQLSTHSVLSVVTGAVLEGEQRAATTVPVAIPAHIYLYIHM